VSEAVEVTMNSNLFGIVGIGLTYRSIRALGRVRRFFDRGRRRFRRRA